MTTKLIYISFSCILISLTAIGCKTKVSGVLNDTTINGQIILRNSSSVEKSLGDIMQKLDTDKDLPDVYFTNKYGIEYLRLIFYPGDVKNTVSFFEVSIVDSIHKNQRIWPTTFTSFTTESGIKIGMTKPEVIEKKGKFFEVDDKGDTVVLRYNTDEKNGGDFLKNYNLPFYFAEYTFKNNILVKFAFGFEYP